MKKFRIFLFIHVAVLNKLQSLYKVFFRILRLFILHDADVKKLAILLLAFTAVNILYTL